MIKEEDKNEVLGRIIEKLQNSPLFLDMKADLQVGFNYWFSYLTQITAAAKGMGETGQFRVLKRVVLLFFFFYQGQSIFKLWWISYGIAIACSNI